MLKEEQAAALLAQCEKTLGRRLSQLRRNLQYADTRAAAIWELLVIDASSEIGTLKYEPYSGGSPDILLQCSQGRTLWIEVTYLFPRFWREERQSHAVTRWIYDEVKRQGISPYKIHVKLDGKRDNKAGPVRTLPSQHERKKFLKEPVLIKFIDDILVKPNEGRYCSLSDYTITIHYNPSAQGPFVSSSGLNQEAPKVIEEHAVYRKLKEKARQHNVSGPRVICIGSDQSPVLSTLASPGQPNVRDAVGKVFMENHSLSAVIIVSISDKASHWGQLQKQARGQIFMNPDAKEPLTQEEAQLLGKMNFNHWKYTYPFPKWEYETTTGLRNVTGLLSCRGKGVGMEIEFPAHILVDALAGKTTLTKEYNLSQNDAIVRALNDGWEIQSCILKKGDLQAGVAAKIVLYMMPVDRVFWPQTKNESNNT